MVVPEQLNSTVVDTGDGTSLLAINAQEQCFCMLEILSGEATLASGPYVVVFRSAPASLETSTFSASTTLMAGKETAVSL